ncbi:PAS domain-containing protein [Variovorax sp. YR752]|uniref:sensor histidine kinase n=1 Tax=Variovorax sp. YR752 TaxID=1884383 RepID=UPI00313779BB
MSRNTDRDDGDALMRDALLGAGTSVWEWDILTDRLTNFRASMALLGHADEGLAPLQQTWNALIHPEDLDANQEAYQRHAREETGIYEHEYRARASDGTWRWVAERGRIVERSPAGEPLRMVGTLTDISQRRAAQGEALALAERLRRIVRNVPGVVYQYRTLPDGSGQFPFISESCIDLLGVMPKELLRDASRAIRLIERDDRERVFASVGRALRAMRQWRCEFRLYLSGGERRWVSVVATPQREADGSVLWHGYLEDISDKRELEQARAAAAAAQAANRAKTEFLSRMSHELRTPLNAVLGFAQLLEIDEREPLTAMQRRRVELVREAGTHLLQMIGELLDLTRIESGQLALATTALPLSPLVADCVELVRPQADAAAVALHVSGVAATVLADPTRLRQVLLNLLSNAIKYNRAGGRVDVEIWDDGAELVASVQDTGVGIAAEDLPTLFQPFQRGAQARGSIEGAGIGLAVTRSLVELMGGRIEVDSVSGVGSTFSVRLPRA